MRAQSSDTAAQWWGRFDLHVGVTGRWDVASLSLAVTRLAREWRMQHRERKFEEGSSASWSVTVPGPVLDDDAKVMRYVVRDPSDAIMIQPALADRPVVTRPVEPIYLQGGEETTIFVSSPLWVNVHSETMDGPFLDVPSHRPSDTWFGPSTMEGEMCYAARTQGRLSLAEVPLRLHRALTALSIRNKGKQPLLLERLKLPVCQLSLFSSARKHKGMLWTSDITIVAGKETELAEIHVETGAPQHIAGAELVSGPREPLENYVLKRAMHALLG